MAKERYTKKVTFRVSDETFAEIQELSQHIDRSDFLREVIAPAVRRKLAEIKKSEVKND